MKQALLCCAVLWLASPARAETFREVNGVVAMEAEHFTRNVGYTVRTDNGETGKAAGFSGDGWVYSDSEVAQRMDYDITFTRTGTYWVHLRGLAGFNADWTTNYEGLDNGYHAELDGVRISGAGIFMKKNQRWVWYGSEQHSTADTGVSFTVATPGPHVFSIVRREQLSRLDKIVIHDGTYGTDGPSTLTGTGPAETLATGSSPDAAHVDDASSAVPDAGSGVLRIEAEHMALQVYRVENGAGFASNDRMITLRDGAAGETGSASYDFTGAPGHYDVVLAYFDESDGVAGLRFHINGDLIASFDLDQGTAHAGASQQSLVRRTLASAHHLARGDTLVVTGVEDPNEPARVDYLELIAEAAPPDAGVVDTAQPDAAQADTAQADTALPDTAQPDTLIDDAVQDDSSAPDAGDLDDAADNTEFDAGAGIDTDNGVASDDAGAAAAGGDEVIFACRAARAPHQLELFGMVLCGLALLRRRRR